MITVKFVPSKSLDQTDRNKRALLLHRIASEGSGLHGECKSFLAAVKEK